MLEIDFHKRISIEQIIDRLNAQTALNITNVDPKYLRFRLGNLIC